MLPVGSMDAVGVVGIWVGILVGVEGAGVGTDWGI